MIQHGVKLSQNQMLKLRRGHRVSLKHSALKGPHKLMLTEAQMKRIEKAMKAGRGTTLQLEPSQINDNIMGGSVLSSLKSVPRKFARLAKSAAVGAYDLAKPVGKALASKAGQRLKAKAQDWLMEKGDKLVEAGLKRIGAGRGRPRKMKPAVMPDMVEGEGFGDFLKGVAKVGKTVGKVGQAVYQNPIGKRLINKVGEKAVDVAVSKAFGGAMRRRRVRVLQPEMEGGNIFTDIYKKVIRPTYSKVLKPAYTKVIKPVGEKVVIPVAKKVAPKLADAAVNLAVKKIAGGRRGRPKKMDGMGLWAPGMGGR